MRTRAFVFVLIAAIALPATALAKGPSGSTEKKSGHVKCGKGVKTPLVTAYAGTNGLELCSSDNLPPDGRIILTPKYVAADGDPSNTEAGDGFIRIDSSGPSCGTAKKHDASKGKGGSCVPPFPPPLPF